ncbi:hypothetical protein NKR23_g4127 [Pleurostoma richardsiae]|uniref:Uncharacterized protein n=1 Tax=Pleurostoma richardsiae TaxID=41990 RepID=A0AA38RKH0_9PEZI|nr:hypothetical protein NKR23_g4127 [Pleurostoma richardsiae]
MDDDASAQQGVPSGAISGRLPRLTEVWNPRDDWSGITDPVERKKRQNRLNQRSWRKRKHAQLEHSPPPELVSAVVLGAVAADFQPSTQQGETIQDEANNTIRQLTHLVHVCPRRRAKVYRFTREAYNDYTMHVPRPTYLPLLIRLNVLHAIARNAAAIGFTAEGLCNDDLISPFNIHGPRRANVPPTWASCPRDLQPTAVQLALTHHPWIDLIPIPVLRDNVLQVAAAGIIDEDELCGDLLDVVDTSTEKASLIIWGESWDIRGWEASVPFLKKWGFLLRGCPEILQATNYWRGRRGEKRLDLTLLP